MNGKIIFNATEDCLASCCLQNQHSSVICTLKAEQKGESDSAVDVQFNLEDRLDMKEMVRNAIVYSILECNCTTRFIVSFQVIEDGTDVFSSALNAYSCCAILAGLRLRDTLVSHTLALDGCLCTVVYMLHKKKIVGLYVDGGDSVCVETVSKCIEGCEIVSKLIKDSVIQYISKDKPIK